LTGSQRLCWSRDTAPSWSTTTFRPKASGEDSQVSRGDSKDTMQGGAAR
jgi:hypothetical protein